VDPPSEIAEQPVARESAENAEAEDAEQATHKVQEQNNAVDTQEQELEAPATDTAEDKAATAEIVGAVNQEGTDVESKPEEEQADPSVAMETPVTAGQNAGNLEFTE
jgi:hypothetical protein